MSNKKRGTTRRRKKVRKACHRQIMELGKRRGSAEKGEGNTKSSPWKKLLEKGGLRGGGRQVLKKKGVQRKENIPWVAEVYLLGGPLEGGVSEEAGKQTRRKSLGRGVKEGLGQGGYGGERD